MHCNMHRKALASMTMTQLLEEALDKTIRLVNIVKANAFNTPQFRRSYQYMESDYERLLLHTVVRWLSKGDMLNRFLHLLPEVIQFWKKGTKEN